MEKYLFVAFRSREHAIKFYEIMRSHRVESYVINTPKDAEIGCGLSVKFFEKSKSSVMSLLFRNNFSSFIGIFDVTVSGNRRYIRPLGLSSSSS